MNRPAKNFASAHTVALAACLLAFSAWAQPATPHLGYVYPAGGRQGTTFQLVAGGQFLNGTTNAFFSGDGIEATVLEYNRPMNQKVFNDLRDELKTLQEKRQAARRNPNSTNTWAAADEKRVAEIRARILKNPPNRQGNPAIAETVTLTVTLATNAAPGEREIRLLTPGGLSNPLKFCVGALPEFSAPPAKATSPELERLRKQFGVASNTSAPNAEPRVSPPCVINGQIMPGAVDRYRFAARRGQSFVISAQARELIPYLADAVPGWFQATLALYDAKGKELAYDDDFEFRPDPVLHFVIPRDGDYAIEIKDAIYRGREDFVYRIELGELPFITSHFPLGGPAGADVSVQLKGWNLPTNQVTKCFDSPGTKSISERREERISNPVPFAVEALPEQNEEEPNNAPRSAQTVTLPVIVNGRIDAPGDEDVFCVNGHAGDQIVVEVFARRLDSPLDSVLKLTDTAGKQLAFNDDHEDKGTGLNTHHADSYLRCTLPADGKYFVQLGDIQHHGGPEYAYRLRLSAPQPDFELRVVPSSVNLRPGTSVPVTVFTLRRDGFTNEIKLSLKDAPPGFALAGARVPAGQDHIRVTLSAPFNAPSEPADLYFEGFAVVQGRAVIHAAVPADDMMQAFLYRHLVPAQELKVAVTGRGAGRAQLRLTGGSPVKISTNGTTRVQLSLPTRGFLPPFRYELSDPPEGLTLQSINPGRDGLELVLQAGAATLKPNTEGNLIVNAFFAGNAQGTNARPQAARQANPIGTLPAIPFVIVP